MRNYYDFLYKSFTLLLVFNLDGLSLQAQESKQRTSAGHGRSDIYIGFSGSFGVRSQTIGSNYEEINSMAVMQQGGSSGIVFGNSMFRMRTEIGFFYSASNVPHTTDLVELSSSLNIYPLQIISRKDRLIEPYLTGGIVRNNNKFYGFYHMKDAGTHINYSVSLEPYIGKVVTSQATFGTGIEIHLRTNNDRPTFLHLFAEAKYSRVLDADNSPLLAKTTLSDQLLASVGFLIGKH